MLCATRKPTHQSAASAAAVHVSEVFPMYPYDDDMALHALVALLLLSLLFGRLMFTPFSIFLLPISDFRFHHAFGIAPSVSQNQNQGIRD